MKIALFCMLVSCSGDTGTTESTNQESTGERILEMCGPTPIYSATYATIGSYSGPRDTATMWRDQFEALITWQDCAKHLP